MEQDPLAAAAAKLVDAKKRLAQAEECFEHSSGHEKPEYYQDVQGCTHEVGVARAAWRALAGADAVEPG
jgi:hypothetical protein